MSNTNGHSGGRGNHAGRPGGGVSRLDELLIDRATVGLDASEEAELQLLLDTIGEPMDLGYESAAAALDLALAALDSGAAGQPPAALPVQLRNKILAAGDQWLAAREAGVEPLGGGNVKTSIDLIHQAGRTGPADNGKRSRGRRDPTGPLARISAAALWARNHGAWMAAAACFAIALVGWMRPTVIQTVQLADSGSAVTGERIAALPEVIGPAFASLTERFEAFISNPDSDILLAPLAFLGGSSALAGPPIPAGDIMWSNTRQKGFAHLTNLPPIEKPGEQYQLWIVDALRSEREPVSAGVFDVPAAGREVLLPIAASIKVGYPSRFAITIERAGGSVLPSGEDIINGQPLAATSAAKPEAGVSSKLPVDGTASPIGQSTGQLIGPASGD